jgi:5-methyltetrahydropteroyltriglutamate--homocysteine methyltransferase
MKRSVDRILTSHVGSLPRPPELLRLYAGGESEELESGLEAAVAAVVRRQIGVGIDIVNDGEFGHPMTDEVDYGAWAMYAYGRLSGYRMVDLPEEAEMPGKDRQDFAEFYASGEAAMTSGGRRYQIGVAMEPIAYSGQAEVRRDVENLKAALDGLDVSEAFIAAMSPAMAGMRPPGSCYATAEEEMVAMAEALREEYRAITAAGFTVQVDDPFLVNLYEFNYSVNGDLKEFRRWAEQHVEVLNHALEGIPEEQVRYHLCWGSWKGPHSSDLPIAEVIDLLPKINASVYSVEAGNVQHEHEWKVWKDVELPEGKAVMPGVVSHKTNVLEHPELVADRLIRYAEAVGRENVIAGTDCGMGGRLHPQLAWAKLKALSGGAALASAELW